MNLSQLPRRLTLAAALLFTALNGAAQAAGATSPEAGIGQAAVGAGIKEGIDLRVNRQLNEMRTGAAAEGVPVDPAEQGLALKSSPRLEGAGSVSGRVAAMEAEVEGLRDAVAAEERTLAGLRAAERNRSLTWAALSLLVLLLAGLYLAGRRRRRDGPAGASARTESKETKDEPSATTAVSIDAPKRLPLRPFKAAAPVQRRAPPVAIADPAPKPERVRVFLRTRRIGMQLACPTA